MPALPKDALIEKQVVVHTGRFVGTEDDENEVQSVVPSLDKGKLCILHYRMKVFQRFQGVAEGKAASAIYYRSSFPNVAAACTVICAKGALDDETEAKLEKALPGLIDQALSVRMFYRPHQALEGNPHS